MSERQENHTGREMDSHLQPEPDQLSVTTDLQHQTVRPITPNQNVYLRDSWAFT